MSDDDQPATKADLRNGLTQLRTALTESTNSSLSQLRTELAASMNTKIESAVDQILRAFRMTEENIRGDCAHVDQVRDLEDRVHALEKKSA